MASGTTAAMLKVVSYEDTTFLGSITSEDDSAEKTIGLLKSGSGTLTLGHGVLNSLTISQGSVSVAQSDGGAWYYNATVTVESDATLKVVAGNNLIALSAGTYNFAPNSLVVDLSNVKATGEDIVLDIITATAINFNTTETASLMTLASGDSVDYEQYISLVNEDAFAEYTKTWTLNGNTLSLTLAIPEPSAFGLLAGLGALALVGTRRRRGKKA